MSTTETTAVEQPSEANEGHAALRMTYEEWLAWDHDGSLSEWVAGEVITHMPPKDEHQNVVEFLLQLLGPFVRLFQLGKMRVAPCTMRILPAGSGREPDLFFLSATQLDRLSRNEFLGPADLVVEVISDDSVTRDREDKFYEYQDGGVREYWIIDPRPGRQRVDLYVLDATGRYQPVPPVDGVFQSAVLPSFWLRESWLWEENPNPLAALAAIVGVECMVEVIRQSQEQ